MTWEFYTWKHQGIFCLYQEKVTASCQNWGGGVKRKEKEQLRSDSEARLTGSLKPGAGRSSVGGSGLRWHSRSGQLGASRRSESGTEEAEACREGEETVQRHRVDSSCWVAHGPLLQAAQPPRLFHVRLTANTLQYCFSELVHEEESYQAVCYPRFDVAIWVVSWHFFWKEPVF